MPDPDNDPSREEPGSDEFPGQNPLNPLSYFSRRGLWLLLLGLVVLIVFETIKTLTGH